MSILNKSTISNIPVGIADLKTLRKVNEKTLFFTASLTKPIFSFLVLKLLNEGLFELDTSLQDMYSGPLPHGKHVDEISIRSILQHSSGLPNVAFYSKLYQEYRPGVKFQYSSEGYTLLQKVIENTTGKNLNTLYYDYIFDPINLNRIFSSFKLFSDDNYAEGYENQRYLNNKVDHKGEFHESFLHRFENVKYNAAGSIWSSSSDYIQLIQHLLHSEPNIVNTMSNYKVFIPRWKASWGLGFGIQNTDVGEMLFHVGNIATYKAIVIVFPTDYYAVTIFTNSTGGKFVYRDIIKLLLGDLPDLILYNNDFTNKMM